MMTEKEPHMKKERRVLTLCLLTAMAVTPFLLKGQTASVPKMETPILLTSCGQSPDLPVLKVVLQKLRLAYDINNLATAADLKAGSRTSGGPYKTIIIVMGASLKGMGAAGISIDDELKRTAALIDEAKKLKIALVGAHVGGMKRRSQGAAVGDTSDEQTIDAVAQKSDLLVVNQEGNSDGRFTMIAVASGIPLVSVEKNLDLVAELGKIFGK
jgi:hypothetical protein